MRRSCLALAVTTALCLSPATDVGAGAKPDKKVKFSAATSRIDPDGNQVLSVTLEVEKGRYIYANPVGNPGLRGAQTDVKVSASVPLESVKVTYPPGAPRSDKDFGEYKVYEGKVSIKVAVKRAAGDSGPLEVTLKLQVCDKNTCRPMMEKLTVK